METTKQVGLTVGGAVIASLIGYAIKGFFGLVMGFILVFLVVGLFIIFIYQGRE